MRRRIIWLVILIVLLIIGWFIYRTLFPKGPILDSIPNPIENKISGNPNEEAVPKDALKEAYFGDLHIHTGMSLDAYIGGIRTTPDQAYQFAKGETIKILDTGRVAIQRPLDFAAITDHSEFLGELYSIYTRGAPAHRSVAAIYLRSVGLDTLKQQELFLRTTGADQERGEEQGFRTHLDFFQGFETTIVGWDIHIDAANKHYEPGKFTTLAGYEWSLGGATTHLHRNVFFGDMNLPAYPISSLEARNEYELWKALEKMRKEGADVIAVPHNSNLSHGGTFTNQQPDGSPYDAEYAKLRASYEPLAEIHQAKGNSEVTASFWPNDEYANFENYARPPDTVTNYVRHALKMGIQYQEELGVNPFKYGLIGSTDTHNGTPGNTEEDDEFIGNHALLDFFHEQRLGRDFPGYDTRVHRIFNPGGLTGVWAEANTRPEIFSALKRKETFATSGTRIKVRLFGGEAFAKAYEDYTSLVKDGYDNGVTMGADLPTDIESPEFLIWAVKDPIGAPLHLIQVIKGWVEDGEMNEEIYDVSTTDDTGAVELTVTWKDPAFDPGQEAFYYVRVLEKPTPRWSRHDELRYNVAYPDDLPEYVHERAWSSPIWYTPVSK